MRNAYSISVAKPEGKRRFEVLDPNGKIILKWI
jgi:hypothetical protein